MVLVWLVVAKKIWTFRLLQIGNHDCHIVTASLRNHTLTRAFHLFHILSNPNLCIKDKPHCFTAHLSLTTHQFFVTFSLPQQRSI